jgi:hypothetical protein
MSLMAPIWLLATLAVVIPLLYHLRRNTPPEVIRVGSVADLGTGAALANRRVPRDLLLLITRCVMLMLLALALAQPLVGTVRSGRRLVVAPTGEWSVVDSLLADGAHLAPGPASRYPWSRAAMARGHVNDTLLLVAPDEAWRWIGPRPTLDPVTMVIAATVDTGTPPGPPLHQRVTSRGPSENPAPREDAAAALWWVILALTPIERILARRSHDAG